MKKICIVLAIMMLMVGCSGETDAEKEARLKEELKEEVMAEMQKQDLMTLTGTYIPFIPTLGSGIALDTPIMINDEEVSEVYFNKDMVEDFIPRKYFTYYPEGGTSVDESYDKKIAIEIEMEPDSYKIDNDFNLPFADITKVISVDGEENPMSKVGNEYPIEYYKEVFYTYCYMNNDVIPKDVKETYYYKNTEDPDVGDLYKKAVDTILESGLYINMGEGMYDITEAPENYLDGETDAVNEIPDTESDTMSNEESQPEVKLENDYTQGYTYEVNNEGLAVTYKNTGNTETVVKYQQYDVTWPRNGQHYPSYTISQIKNPKHSIDNTNLYFLQGADLLSYNFESNQVYIYLFESGSVHVQDYILVEDGQYAGYYAILTDKDEQKLFDSKGNEVMDIESIYGTIKQVEEEQYDGSQNIIGFGEEKINGTTVDYSDYIAVVIPQYSGKYEDSLTDEYVYVGAILETPSYEAGETHAMVFGPQKVWKDSARLAVFGTVNSMTIKYVNDAENETETVTKENISNTLFSIHTNFVNDMTYIKVSFKVTLPDGRTYSDSFTLDDMRDISEYEPIMVEYE